VLVEWLLCLITTLLGHRWHTASNVIRPKHLIVVAEFLASLATALTGLAESPAIWTHGIDDPSFHLIASYFDNTESQESVRLDKTLYDRIQGGQIRL